MSIADTYLDTAAASEEIRLWGEVVSIRRGSTTQASVDAQKFSGDHFVNFDDGGRVQHYDGEWVIQKTEYMIDDIVVSPRSGDRIIETDGTEWELRPIENLSEAVEQQGGLEWLLRVTRMAAP